MMTVVPVRFLPEPGGQAGKVHYWFLSSFKYRKPEGKIIHPVWAPDAEAGIQQSVYSAGHVGHYKYSDTVAGYLFY